MAKIQDLAQHLSLKHKIQQKEAEHFLMVLVEVLNEGLRREKQVKVKGLGTFKVIDVKDRESVNVNTGERIVIGGRSKITFTPDAVMKDLVNKPFAQFETVVLNEGVTFEDIPEESLTPAGEDHKEEESPAEEEATQQKPVAEEPEPLVEEAPPVTEEPEPQPEIEQLMEEEAEVEVEAVQEKESETEQEVATEQFETIVEAPAEENTEEETRQAECIAAEVSPLAREEVTASPVNEHTAKSKTLWWLLGMVAVGALMFYAGHYHGYQTAMNDRNQNSVRMKVTTKKPVIAKVDSVGQKAEETDRTEVLAKAQAEKAKADSMAKAEAYVKAEAAKKAAYEAERKKQIEEEAARKTATTTPGADAKALSNARSIVNTGAYKIVGTQETVTVRKGQTLQKISKFYFGDGMEAYIIAHNGVSEVKEGMKLKIPKLQSKKK